MTNWQKVDFLTRIRTRDYTVYWIFHLFVCFIGQQKLKIYSEIPTSYPNYPSAQPQHLSFVPSGLAPQWARFPAGSNPINEILMWSILSIRSASAAQLPALNGHSNGQQANNNSVFSELLIASLGRVTLGPIGIDFDSDRLPYLTTTDRNKLVSHGSGNTSPNNPQ